MKTKIVYTLTSSEQDIYLEQTLVSLISLRIYNPEAYVVLITDKQTEQTLEGFRATIFNYINEKIVVTTPPNYTQAQRSRYIKTTLRQHLSGAFLFIDGDTIIASQLNEIDDLIEKKVEIAMVADYHVRFHDYESYFKSIKEKIKRYGWNLTKNDIIYFNSGVMFVNDTAKTRDFFNLWNKHWTSHINDGLHFDQPPLTKTNQVFNYIITELNGCWNCQIIFNGLQYLHNAKIIHYFTSLSNSLSPYFFANKEPFWGIKQKQEISPDFMKYVVNPKGAFNYAINLIGYDFNFVNSGMYRLYKWNYRYYRIVEYLAYNIYRMFSFKKDKNT